MVIFKLENVENGENGDDQIKKNSFKFVIILGPALRKYLYLKMVKTIFLALCLYIIQYNIYLVNFLQFKCFIKKTNLNTFKIIY